MQRANHFLQDLDNEQQRHAEFISASQIQRYEMAFYVYIMANKINSVVYIGMTNNLIRRVYDHREGLIDGFTKDYNVKKLVYFETHETAYEAITREKKLKNWHRDWKDNLIKEGNPNWDDLYVGLL
jgi:putative endonuclease